MDYLRDVFRKRKKNGCPGGHPAFINVLLCTNNFS